MAQAYAQTDWETKRLAKLSASGFYNLMTKPKSAIAQMDGELSETAKNYVIEKVGEMMTGQVKKASGSAIDWGNQYEPVAQEEIKKLYPSFIAYGKENQKFFEYSDFSGASTDGIILDQLKIVEIKCPESPANHIQYCLLKNQQDLKASCKDHYYQIQFGMASFAKENDIPFENMRGIFISFHPMVLEGFKKLHRIEVSPDMDFFSQLPGIIQRAEDFMRKIYLEVYSDFPDIP